MKHNDNVHGIESTQHCSAEPIEVISLTLFQVFKDETTNDVRMYIIKI